MRISNNHKIMKRIGLSVLVSFLCMSLMAQKSCVTFQVDKDLPAAMPEEYSSEEASLIRLVLEDNNESGGTYLKSSLNGENLRYMHKDAFYQSVVRSFAEHKSLVLSPDMIWLIISQEFSYYVNHNSEKLREKMVLHSGKMELKVEDNSKNTLFDATDQEWSLLIDKLVEQIDQNTKSDFAKNMVADFTTTAQTELIASKVVLMDIVKPYFEYIAIRSVCGIPSITLLGTKEDWQKVYDKTMNLNAYGLGWWTKELKPILQEFINASKGNLNTAFWQDIVCINTPKRLRGGGCSTEKPTEIDGWILKFFPFDKEGGIQTKLKHTDHMMTEMVKVPFTYRLIDDATGDVVRTVHMELWGGFIGAEEDSKTLAITPKIGWIVRLAETDNEILENKLKWSNELSLKVSIVPEFLSKAEKLEILELEFVDKVVFPDWMNGEWMERAGLKRFTITGKMTNKEKEALKKQLPKAQIIANPN